VNRHVSPFGPFRLLQGANCPPEQVQAQLKGLDLLYNLATSSDVWTIETSRFNPAWKRIVSTDGVPVVSIDPMMTVMYHLNQRDNHLRIELDEELLCILNDENTTCALVDGLISTVLLGEAGWPTSHTPRPLRPKSRAVARRDRRNLKSSFGPNAGLFGLPFTAKHLDVYRDMQRQMLIGNKVERLSRLGTYARRLYVCFSLDEIAVQRHLTLLMGGIAPSELMAYVEAPMEPTDALFLEPILNAWIEQGLSASFEDIEGVTEWTRIWT
jgi:hypothetical protein